MRDGRINIISVDPLAPTTANAKPRSEVIFDTTNDTNKESSF